MTPGLGWGSGGGGIKRRPGGGLPKEPHDDDGIRLGGGSLVRMIWDRAWPVLGRGRFSKIYREPSQMTIRQIPPNQTNEFIVYILSLHGKQAPTFYVLILLPLYVLIGRTERLMFPPIQRDIAIYRSSMHEGCQASNRSRTGRAEIRQE